MDLPEQAFTDPDVATAWTSGLRRTLLDQSREVADRIDAGCSLVSLAMLDVDAEILDRGAVPAHLPADLHEKWLIAFDDYSAADDRLAAVIDVLEHLDGAVLARVGDGILRRELGA